MGIKLFSSSSYDSPSKVIPPIANGNPDPTNFKILEQEVFPKSGTTVVKVQYPDCNNYEGLKILVFATGKGVEFIKWRNKGSLDPHFSENADFISPIARFEPTDKGWTMATEFAKSL